MKTERLDVQIYFRATIAERDRLERMAADEERSVSHILRRMFRTALAKPESRKARQLVGSK